MQKNDEKPEADMFSNYFRIFETVKFTEIQFFKTSYDGHIQNLCFSSNNDYIAFSQSNRISVYFKNHKKKE